MKFYIHKQDKSKWHIWFAWYPVQVQTTPDGDLVYIWLKNVLRCEYQVLDLIYPKKKIYKEILETK